jgi:ribosomal protein S18 acetylase RimI-like enzyme
MTGSLKIRALGPFDRAWADSLVSEHFGSSRLVSRGVLYEAGSLPGLVAERAGRRVGLVQYRVAESACEVVVLLAAVRRQGIGRALLGAVQPVARAAGCRRLWLVTTNNNQAAQAFYRSVGWRQAAVYRGAVEAGRRLKPEIPRMDADGTPIADEVEFELLLPAGRLKPAGCPDDRIGD